MSSTLRALPDGSQPDSHEPEADEIQLFLDRICALIQNDEPRRAIDAIFQEVNSLLVASRFDDCDQLLRRIDLDRIPPLLLASFLTITVAAKEQLPTRAEFYRQVRDRVETQRGVEGANRLLAGLE